MLPFLRREALPSGKAAVAGDKISRLFLQKRREMTVFAVLSGGKRARNLSKRLYCNTLESGNLNMDFPARDDFATDIRPSEPGP